MVHKNIHIFRWQNGLLIQETIGVWKRKFIEKYGEMNLTHIYKQDFNTALLSDCISPGFMGMTRMIIFSDLLVKTEKEMEIMIRNNRTISLQENTDLVEDDTQLIASVQDPDNLLWQQALLQAPETNFFVFIGNKIPASNLERWLLENAAIHEFSILSDASVRQYICDNLGVTARQASYIQNRLNNNYDFIYQEVRKLQLSHHKNWTDDELYQVLPNYFEENTFNILAPLWRKDAQSLLRTFRDVFRTADRETTMAMMTTIIRKVLIASTIPDSAQHLPITEHQQNTAKKLTPTAKQHLVSLYIDLVESDAAEKQGNSPEKLDAFLTALLKYCLS